MPPPITTAALWFGRLRCLWHLGHRATEPGPHGQRFEPPQRTVPRPALASTRSCKGCSILSHFRDPQQPSFLFWDCLIKWRKSEKGFLVVGQDRTSFNMGVFSDRPTVHEAFCQGNKVLELVATPLCTATQLDFAATLKADSIGNQGQAMSSSGTCAKA